VSSDGDVGIGTQTLDSKFAVYQNGGGGGGLFEIDHSVNEEAAISVRTNGIGNAGLFQVLNSVNTNAAVRGQTTGAGHAGWFEVMNPGNDAPVLYAGGSGTGPAALIDGDLHVSDDIRQDFGGTFIRTTPIAYATVEFNGSILSGTPNIMVSHEFFDRRYEISVSGETLNTTNYTTLVLPITEGSAPIVPSIKANESGELLLTLVALEELLGTPDFQDVFSRFQIVIFKGE